jgi:putative ABC transport system permease protein
MSLSTLRSLAGSRALSTMVVATLAIGIAIFAATFGVINAALFRAPPFADAERVALLFMQRNPQGEPPRQERWSFPRFELLRKSQTVFEDVATYSPASLTLAGEGAELVEGERVSATYFPLLRVSAARGRLFTEAEDDPARPAHVVVLSERLWHRRYAADPAIIGQTIRLNSVPLAVIGVLPADFSGLSGRSELWIPRALSPLLTYPEYLTTNQNFISAVGRLRPGIDFAAAQGELAVLGARINRAIPSDPDFPEERVSATATPLNEARVNKTVRRSLIVLLGAVAVLHLLACANVTNLLLGRVAAKKRECAVRLALGSSSNRLFRHIFAEGLLLGGAGGVLGILLAWWACTVVVPPTNVWAPRNFYGSLAPFDAPSFGGTEFFVALALAVASAILVALPPALSAFRIDVANGIKTGARTTATGAIGLRHPSARNIIVGVEAALAMLLLVTAGLLIDSFQRMQRVSIGVDPENVLTFWVIPSEARVPPARAPAFVSQLIAALEGVPGVRSVSVDGGAPMAGTASSVLFIQGRPAPGPGQAPPVLRHYIAPNHFATLGIPVLRGRAFTAADVAGAPRVALISEGAARRFWPDEDPIGQRVWFGGGSNFNSADSAATIVGIVGDVVYAPLDQRPNSASFYTPYAQFTYAARMVFVRTNGNPRSVVPDVRKAIASVDPELAPREVQPLTDVISGSWARNRFDAFLFGGFGSAALLLAASGIFAVLSYAVAGRTREFGIRITLGATTRRVLGHVLREGTAFPIAGLLVGVAAAFGLTRFLRSSLYEISPTEPGVFLATAALLLLVTVAACLLPAWRATRADPMEALRSE